VKRGDRGIVVHGVSLRWEVLAGFDTRHDTPPSQAASPIFRHSSPLNGERLFAFTRLDPSQWRSARTTNAIERLNEEFRRRIKTQTVLPCAETVPMLLWALLASGQITMRKVDGWETLSQPIEPFALDQAA
jgi:transposase-like protein